MGFRDRPRSNAEAIAGAIGGGGDSISSGLADAGDAQRKINKDKKDKERDDLSNALQRRQNELLAKQAGGKSGGRQSVNQSRF